MESTEACFIRVVRRVARKHPRRGYKGIQEQIAPRDTACALEATSAVAQVLVASTRARDKNNKGSLGLENSDRLSFNVGHVRERLLKVQLVAFVDDLVLHIDSGGNAGRASGAGGYGGGKEG